MNKYEFTASGQLLFGRSWKNDMARMLDFSTQAKHVAKLSEGQRKISAEVADQILKEFQLKAKIFLQAASFLDNPCKIKTVSNDQMCLFIDHDGLRQLPLSGVKNCSGLALQSLAIKGKEQAEYLLSHDYAFQNEVIKIIFMQCKEQNNFELMEEYLNIYLDIPVGLKLFEFS